MKIRFGVDYYPEHWPRDRWQIDADMMHEMGLDVVRMAEFSWSLLEPEEGKFSFQWLDDAIDLLSKSGMKIILGTPSASPPAWIIAENPEIQPIDSEGRRHFFGGRHHCCQSNTIYRAHIQRYVTAFANHFRVNPNVIGWQIDNELGNSHGDLCYCESCERSFRDWLIKKYGDIGELNRAWGTVFWSQSYLNFSQIQAPKLTAAGQNPSQLLDWKRFCSDLIVEFHKFQADILRKAAPEKFITHNLMGFSEKVNYFDLGKDCDFVSHDQYPGGHFHSKERVNSPMLNAAQLDLIRGIKQKNFWIMEQQSGMTGWDVLGRAPKPGQLGMWAMQAVAHGADAIVFFRWRTCTVGTEQYWHGILPHCGQPGRYHDELKEYIQKAKPLMNEIHGTIPKASAGIVFSYDQAYAMEIQPHHPDLSYTGQILLYYRALFDRNVPVDFVSDKADFNAYDLIVAPLQYLMTPELDQKYKDFVRNGGTLLLTMRTRVKDSTNLCMTDGRLPGDLRDLLGLEIPEYDCLRDASMQVIWDGEKLDCDKWCDIISLTGAEALAIYDSEFYAGSAAVTLNKFGKGRAYYIGTEPGRNLADRLVQEWIDEEIIQTLGDSPENVEISHRSSEDKEYIFIINHSDTEQKVDIPPDWKTYYAEQSEFLQPFSVDVYIM